MSRRSPGGIGNSARASEGALWREAGLRGLCTWWCLGRGGRLGQRSVEPLAPLRLERSPWLETSYFRKALINLAGAGIERRFCALTPRRLRSELLAGATPGGIWGSPPAALGNTPLTWTHPLEMLGLLCAVSRDVLSRIPRCGICSQPRSLTPAEFSFPVPGPYPTHPLAKWTKKL